MTSRISCICIDSPDPRPLADFWSEVLGWDVVEDSDEGVSLAPRGGGVTTLDILPVPEAKLVKNRLHLDLRADGNSFDEELDRLEDLGAARVDVGQSPEVTWVVLADPQGNEFCLLRRTVQEMQGLTAL